MSPIPQTSGSAFFVTLRSRLAKYRPRVTPLIPAAHVITPKIRLTLSNTIYSQLAFVDDAKSDAV